MFFKYPSLVNHYAIGRENRIVQRLDELWIATEKIHGANASYIIDKEGNKKYSEYVIDKLAYANYKIDSYESRIPQLNSSLLSKGIFTPTIAGSSLSVPKLIIW